MKKKVLCIVLAIVLLLLIAAGVVLYQNRSLVKVLFMDTEETKQTTVNDGEKFRMELEETLGFELPPFTEEEKQKIAKGEVSVSQLLIERIEAYVEAHPEAFAENGLPIGGETGTDSSSGKGASSGGSQSSGNAASTQEIIVRYTGEFSAIRGRYVGALDGLISAAKAEMQPGKRTEVATRYSGQIRALESSCDAEVEALLGRMAAELSAAGGDLSIIDTIRQNYASEKAAREVYYRDKFASML